MLNASTPIGKTWPANVAMFWGGIFVFLLLAKCCHLHILWAEEGYGSAAAVQILRGKLIYRDFWFDKPPLAALLYVLWHGRPGFGLRLADALYALACAAAAFRIARRLWSGREGLWAASLMAFFLVFDIPASITTLAPDLLLILPTLAAIDCAVRRQPFLSGIWCSVGFAVNAKAAAILVVCAVWCWPAVWPLAIGFIAGTLPWAIWLAASHALPNYLQQVWWFGSQYSRDTFIAHPIAEGLERTLHWAGFHAALVLGAALCFYLRKSWHFTAWLTWLAAGLVCIAAGERFFERYYFVLLPPMVLLAAGGIATAQGFGRSTGGWRRCAKPKIKKHCRIIALLLLSVPLVRFGPRYVMLAADVVKGRTTQWSDVSLNKDSFGVSRIILTQARSRDTLLVWGYRPDIFAYTQLPVAGKFLDSQLLTGVIADRHLTSTHATFPVLAAENRSQLLLLRPTWIVDGLADSNPALAITAYPELKIWLEANYSRRATTRESILYHLKGSSPAP